MKCGVNDIYDKESYVAPYTGAWIEIKYVKNGVYTIESHPTRVRGLKLYFSLRVD